MPVVQPVALPADSECVVTAPRWIAEALDACGVIADKCTDDIAKALIERLPIEAMVTAATMSMHGDGVTDRAVAREAVANIMRILTDGDPEVVELTELYQGACRALDAAGVPYAIDAEIQPHIMIKTTIGETAPHKPAEVHHVPARPCTLQLGLAGRIQWLAQQRPTRIELQRLQAELQAAADSERAVFIKKYEDAQATADKLALLVDAAAKRMKEMETDLSVLRDQLAEAGR